jgi:hypothetical protein
VGERERAGEQRHGQREREERSDEGHGARMVATAG